jgi:VCBS repeat-containing protein
VANDDGYVTDEDTPLNVAAPGILGNDTDLEGNPLTAVLDVGPSKGTLTAFNTDGSFTYTPDPDFESSDSFTYYANDGTVNSVAPRTVTITVNAQNDAPVAADDDYTTSEDSPVMNVAAPGVLDNDTDVDGDPLSAALSTDVTNGTLVLNPDGSFDYTPDPDFNGSDSFTYHANDGTVNSAAPATVTITVDAVNDPPVAVDDDYLTIQNMFWDVVTEGGVLANDTDAENDPLTAVLVTDVSNGILSLAGDGRFTYDPNLDFIGTDSFTYFSNDGTVDSNTATVTITVNGPCGGGLDITASHWTMVSLPCTPLVGTVDGVYNNDGLGAYGNGSDWLMYEWDAVANEYRLLELDDPLWEGAGYWLLSDNASTVHAEGGLPPVITSAECASANGCYEIEITQPPVGVEKQSNLVGNPFPYPVNWADARIVVTGGILAGTYNPADAETNGVGRATIYVYESGSSYASYDDQTPGMLGILNPGQSFWYQVTADPNESGHPGRTGNIRILIPAEPYTGPQGAFNDTGAPDYKLFAGVWKVLWEVADFLVPSAHADKPPKDDNPGHQRRKARLEAKEWYVRLIAEWPAGNLKDRNNVLGELVDSDPGFDVHDLKELPPFSTQFLTVVFPHDDWGETGERSR